MILTKRLARGVVEGKVRKLGTGWSLDSLSPSSSVFLPVSFLIILFPLLLLLSCSWVGGAEGAGPRLRSFANAGGGGKPTLWRHRGKAVKENNSSVSDSGGNINTNVTKTKMIDVDQIMNDMGMGSSDSEEAGLSTVKIIPDEHHVSDFLNKGIPKRFLFMNDKEDNPLSITITPCTSILLWNVKFWPVFENGTQTPENLKTYRTQRTVTFAEEKARRGVYSVEIRPLHWDSYVHFYATSSNAEPIRASTSSFYENDHYFHHHHNSQTHPHQDSNSMNNGNGFQIPMALVYNKPRVSVRRLRGNRLHVKWDTSPVNPHLMQYCIVVNTRRDYSSLCAASGERYGVLPPDLMHVSYYSTYPGYTSPNLGFRFDYSNNEREERFKLLLQQQNQLNNFVSNGETQTHRDNRRTKFDDIIIGCVNKKTNYILNNLQEGRLYYFNVFLKDLSTNLTYPYVRTTLKYRIPKNVPNGLRDAKPLKIKLFSEKSTTLKFNLNKPCSELTMYTMPCGGGSITYHIFHGNKSIFQSDSVDSLDIIKIAMPQRGKYYVRIFPSSLLNTTFSSHQARMAEVYVSKKNKRFPLPKLPEIPRIFEDDLARSCDSVTIQWWPSPDPRDNEYCIFLKEETRKRIFHFKKPNQCDVERSLKSDPYVTFSLCLQRSPNPDTLLLSQRIGGLQPSKTYVVQLIVRRYNGKSLSYDLHYVRTLEKCAES